MSYLTRTSPRRTDRSVSKPYTANPADAVRNVIVALDGAPDFNDGADLRPRPLSDRGARLQTLLADRAPGDAARIRSISKPEALRF